MSSPSRAESVGFEAEVDVGILAMQYTQKLQAYFVGKGLSFEDAQDLSQTTLLRAFERRSQLRDPERAAAWLFMIARRAWLLHLRQLRANQMSYEDDIESLIASDNVEQLVTVRVDVDAALAKCSARDREVLWLHHACGVDGNRIAEHLGLSPPAARKRLQRARDRLAHMYGDSIRQHAIRRSGDCEVRDAE